MQRAGADGQDDGDAHDGPEDDDAEHRAARGERGGEAGAGGGAGGAGLSFRPGPEEEQRLRELDRALDVYADLLVAEGVTLAATRRADRAADALRGG